MSNDPLKDLQAKYNDLQAKYNELRRDDRELAKSANILRTLAMKIEQEVVDVEKVDPDNLLAKRLRSILGHDSDPRNN